jgi:hypothetical protein
VKAVLAKLQKLLKNVSLLQIIFMSKEEIKYEINKVLDLLPGKALEDLLSFLKNVEAKSNDTLLDSDRLKRILTEDKELLQKLA